MSLSFRCFVCHSKLSEALFSVACLLCDESAFLLGLRWLTFRLVRSGAFFPAVPRTDFVIPTGATAPYAVAEWRDRGTMSALRKSLLVFLFFPFAILFCFSSYSQSFPQTGAQRREFLHKLSDAAIERTHHTVRYDPAYVRISYPGGDVPAGTGVCTDEVIRAYRAVGVDLQKEVHEDIAQNPSAYPHKWNLLSWRPDSNSDH